MEEDSQTQPNHLSKEELLSLYGEKYVARFEKYKLLQEKRLKGIIKHVSLNKGLSIADYGCGNGQLFELLHNEIGTYAGIDFSQSFIDSFKRKLGDKKYKIEPKLYCQDIIEFSKIHEEDFDVAFTLDFSEHIYDDEFIKIYTAIYQSLKPGGRLILHTPNGNFFLEWLRNKGILKQSVEHVAVRSAQQYLPLLNQVGFSQVEVIYIPHYNVLKYLHPLSFIPIFGKYFEARMLLTCIKR